MLTEGIPVFYVTAACLRPNIRPLGCIAVDAHCLPSLPLVSFPLLCESDKQCVVGKGDACTFA